MVCMLRGWEKDLELGSEASQKLRRPGGRRRRLGPGIAHSQAWLPELARKKAEATQVQAWSCPHRGAEIGEQRV